MRTVSFTIAGLTPSPNTLMRTHWAKRSKMTRELAWKIREAIAGGLPEAPFATSRVSVWRHSIQPLDADALCASAKLLMDAMQPASKRHPYGLGIIADDRADVCELNVRWVKAKRRVDQRMVVEVCDATPEAAT